MVKAYADLAGMPDEQRIDVIAKTLLSGSKSSADKPLIVGVVIDDTPKAERYIALMKERHPAVRVIDHKLMGLGKTVLIRFGEPLR